MTITTTIIRRSVFGNMKIVVGSCANDSTGGDVETGLNSVEAFCPTVLGGTIYGFSVNETFPLAGGAVTVVTQTGIAFSWIAFGK